MAQGSYGYPSSSSAIQDWRAAYQCVLSEMDKSALFKRVEVAEAAIRTRRDILSHNPDQQAELQAMEGALDNLKLIKSKRLDFTSEE
jgi:hypothetical protein